MKTLATLVCISFTSLALSQYKSGDIVSQHYERTFDFILKLDSLGKKQGKIEYRYNGGEKYQLDAKYTPVSDSVYSVKIRGDQFLVNRKSGRVTHQKTGDVVYRNWVFRVSEQNKLKSEGADQLGSYTSYFKHAGDIIPFRKDYTTVNLDTATTLDYEIRFMHLANDDGSRELQSDTLRVIKKWDNHNRLLHEKSERFGTMFLENREIIEYNYSYIGDTVIRQLSRHERLLPEPSEEGSQTKTGSYPMVMQKTVSKLTDSGSINWEYSLYNSDQYKQIATKSESLQSIGKMVRLDVTQTYENFHSTSQSISHSTSYSLTLFE